MSGYRIIRQGGRGLRHLQASIAIVNLRLEKLGKRMIAEGIDDGDEGDGGYKGKEKRLTGDKWKESIEDIGGEEWMDCGRLKAKCRIDMVICLVAAIALLEVYFLSSPTSHIIALYFLLTCRDSMDKAAPKTGESTCED